MILDKKSSSYYNWSYLKIRNCKYTFEIVSTDPWFLTDSYLFKIILINKYLSKKLFKNLLY